MFTWLGLIYLVLAGSGPVVCDRGPVVRLDNAVGSLFLRLPFGGY